MIDFNTFTKLPKNVGDLGKVIVAKGFKKLHKVQKIAKSGHTVISAYSIDPARIEKSFFEKK